MALVSDHFRFVYLYTPGTGSSAIGRALREHCPDVSVVPRKPIFEQGSLAISSKHIGRRELIERGLLTPDQLAYPSFCGVRSPFSHVYASYRRWRTKWLERSQTEERPKHWINQPRAQGALRRAQRDFRACYCWAVLSNQRSGPFLPRWTKGTTHLVRQEHMQVDFDRVAAQLGLPPGIRVERINVTGGGRQAPVDYDALFSEEQVGAFHYFWGTWMERLGYTFPGAHDATELGQAFRRRFPTQAAARLYCAQRALEAEPDDEELRQVVAQRAQEHEASLRA